MRKLSFVGILFFVFGCSSPSDPYSEEIKRLGIERESQRASYEGYEKKVESLPLSAEDQSFKTEKDAEDGLKFLEQYPKAPTAELKIQGMLQQGIPDSANQREIFKERGGRFVAKVVPYSDLCVHLIKSAERFKWSSSKRQSLGLLILSREIADLENPNCLLKALLGVHTLQKVLESKLLKDPNNNLEKLNSFMAEGKQESREIKNTISHWYYFPNLVFGKRKLVAKYAPEFFLKKWNRLLTDEYSFTKEFEKRLRPILKEIQAANAS